MSTSFGTNLRNNRKNLKMTVAMVSKICGTSRSYITLIENDKRLPGKKVLPKIATALNLKTVVVLNWYLEHVNQKMRSHLKI